MFKLLIQSWKTKDIPSLLLFTAIAVAGLWIAALPLSTTVQQEYLNRFHLATASFPVWAVQQTVPSMYNFENKAWFSPEPLMQYEIDRLENQESGIIDPSAGETNNVTSEMVNHFPTRIATFADKRMNLLRNPHSYLYLRTKYRGQEIRSTFRIEPGTESEFKLRRVVTSFE